MSADNWTVCPRCKARHIAKRIEARAVANNSYGAVPLEQWQALDKAADDLAQDWDHKTFREDYEIYGADEGSIEVSYRGGCGECGLSVGFVHSHEIKGVDL